jgi:protein-disulfide isomerase
MAVSLTRATFLRLAGGMALLPLTKTFARSAENEVTRDMILADPEAPIGGNPDGDVTIVDFFDYNCPYCKKSATHLERLVKTDGKIKLIYKDWPILSETSIIGAQFALGAKYQGKYLEAHHALMNIPGSGISQEQMLDAIRKAGVDMERLDADVKANSTPIEQLIKRNLTIAEAIGLQGTPGFLVGPYMVNQALNYEGFQHVVADARAKQRK